MNENEEVPKTDQEIASTGETASSKEETTENYKVGYRKPPKETQFKKGTSGNPSGRPKKAPDFFAELRREANRLIPINENGRTVRISKLKGIARQTTNKALTGHNSSVKTFVGFYQQGVEEETSSASQQVKDLERYNNPRELTREELMRIILEDQEEKKKKGGE